jgi:hypothetical protein
MRTERSCCRLFRRKNPAVRTLLDRQPSISLSLNLFILTPEGKIHTSRVGATKEMPRHNTGEAVATKQSIRKAQAWDFLVNIKDVKSGNKHTYDVGNCAGLLERRLGRRHRGCDSSRSGLYTHAVKTPRSFKPTRPPKDAIS